ncbi:MAG: extracellular solute-binding protein, partial [Mycobacterium sp.]|nr:extracellular solute-binding protein [Mycobacterium sp.]
YYDVAETDHAVQAGLIAWQSDYVAPSSFLNELLACAKATPDGANLGRACDHTLDAAITSALASQTTQALDAITRWTAVDKSATDAAIDVPINNAVQYVYLARRVGNYQSNPQWGLLVDQLWVD